MDQPLLSVIIPTYNRGHLVERAIRSVRAQQYTNWQLIVIDDGSTDDTKERLAAYDDLTYYYQPNRGQAAARNRGLQHCRGEFITTLDSDDEWHPNFLGDGMAMLLKHELDFVFMNWVTSKGEEGYTSYFSRHRNRYCTQHDETWWLLDPKQNRRLFVETCPSPSSSLIIRRSSFPGGWNQQMRIADDWCLMLDMVLNRQCHSAFSPVRHWTKHIQGDNIWDCRDNTVIIPEVGFHDEQVLTNRFRDQLTLREKRLFRRRLALHHFHFAYFSWKQAVASSATVLQHLAVALRLSPTAVSRILLTWGQQHLRKRLRRTRPTTGLAPETLVEPTGTAHEPKPLRAPQTTAGAPAAPRHPSDGDRAALPAGRLGKT